MCAHTRRRVTLRKERWTWEHTHHKNSESTFHRDHAFERMRRQRNQSLGFTTSHSFRLRACFWLGFRLKFLLSLFLCSSHDLVRQAHLRARVVRHLHHRRTLHNFCQLGLTPARRSDHPKKSAIHSPQFLSARPSTCPRFRPEKKSASHSPQFLSSRPEHLPEVQTRKKKEKCDPLSTISVSSAKHLPEVQTRKKSAIHSPQFLSARPGTCPRLRPEKKKSAIHAPQFLSARPGTCPRFTPEQKSAIHSPQFLSARPSTC